MKRQIRASLNRYGDNFTIRMIREKIDELADLVQDCDDDTYQAIHGDDIADYLLRAKSFVDDAYDAVNKGGI